MYVLSFLRKNILSLFSNNCDRQNCYPRIKTKSETVCFCNNNTPKEVINFKNNNLLCNFYNTYLFKNNNGREYS